ncbi:MAG TPA: energy transducer TonB [Vicinamibacterales bacterium]|nr:energy transducer TonB [Vicinamibacterales bacterium]
MSVLFNDARFNTRASPHSASSTGLWLSVVVHATLAGVLTAVVPTRASERTSTRRPRSIAVFTLTSSGPVMLPATRVETLPLHVPPVPIPPPSHDDVAAVPKPVVVARLAARPVEPVQAALLPAVAAAIERPLEIKPPERPPETGLFERTNSTRASQAASAVATGGFGRTAASATTQSDAAITTGGFGSVAPSARAAASAADDVRTAGFDRRASAPVQSSVTAAPSPIDRPLEILSKPTPEYTDEARSARIEGIVTLDLEFTAAGDVRVLRVVRGLGHGLDEAAERAALRIRFKPAQSNGQAVDSRATVHITFRLS